VLHPKLGGRLKPSKKAWFTSVNFGYETKTNKGIIIKREKGEDGGRGGKTQKEEGRGGSLSFS